MSTSTPKTYTSVYGPLIGRGHVERFTISNLRRWIIPYIAEYERQNFLRPRSTPVPPTPESIHGDMDFNRFEADLFPEVAVVVQPVGEVERHEGGEYGSWFQIQVAAFVQVEGDQDGTRALADIYGTVLQSVITEQGIFGAESDGVTPVVTRVRLWTAYGLTFPQEDVRDVIQATFGAHCFVANIVSDFAGPDKPPQNPYADPDTWPNADKVVIGVIRGTPDTHGIVEADALIIDETVYPGITRYEEITVDEP